MEAIYVGTGGGWCGGPGSVPGDAGPWVLADLENGLCAFDARHAAPAHAACAMQP